MQIYLLENNSEFMAYWFLDEPLGRKLLRSGRVVLPDADDLPLQMAPSFGDSKKQPRRLGDLHRFDGSCPLFSERAVEALSLRDSGRLFPVELEGRSEKFYWYWSTTVIDCLDESRTKRLLGSIHDPAFFEERIRNARLFTTPDDQSFQSRLYVTDGFRDTLIAAKLKGFVLRRGASDTKPWKS